jgi:PTS system nitrogen regulatory IIA component
MMDVPTHEICMDAGSVTDVFRAVAATIGDGMSLGEIDAEAVREALTKREREGSTAIGRGSAIPHARVEGLNESILLDVKLRRPVRWDDGEDVQRCMVILVPPDAHDQHLQLTARAVRELTESDL